MNKPQRTVLAISAIVAIVVLATVIGILFPPAALPFLAIGIKAIAPIVMASTLTKAMFFGGLTLINIAFQGIIRAFIRPPVTSLPKQSQNDLDWNKTSHSNDITHSNKNDPNNSYTNMMHSDIGTKNNETDQCNNNNTYRDDDRSSLLNPNSSTKMDDMKQPMDSSNQATTIKLSMGGGKETNQ